MVGYGYRKRDLSDDELRRIRIRQAQQMVEAYAEANGLSIHMDFATNTMTVKPKEAE
jgi:hypothetical protein